jgi:polar amino acid transport system ATP-binding protein
MSGIRLSLVRKTLGGQRVLDGVSMEVVPGEVLAIIGRSGSGKSTLLRCVNGLETIESGSIEVAGISVTDGRSSLRQVRRLVGMVFQSYNLFPHLSVCRNITLAPTVLGLMDETAAKARAREVLARVGLEDRIDASPSTLSGGQQQRVAIARCLAMAPQILLLDEVTSALDPESTNDVLGLLADLAGSGTTMVLVTHELMFARRIADRVAFMHEGRILEIRQADRVLDEPSTAEMRLFMRSAGNSATGAPTLVGMRSI